MLAQLSADGAAFLSKISDNVPKRLLDVTISGLCNPLHCRY
jgi:hypothetical protein